MESVLEMSSYGLKTCCWFSLYASRWVTRCPFLARRLKQNIAHARPLWTPGLLTWYFVFLCHNKLFTYEYRPTAAFVLSFYVYNFYEVFLFVWTQRPLLSLLLLLCHVCYCDACKCLHGLGVCVWFYPNKLMMMMMMMRLQLKAAWSL